MLNKLYLNLARFFVKKLIQSDNDTIASVTFKTKAYREMEEVDRNIDWLNSLPTEEAQAVADWKDVNLEELTA